jgi:hypothetical protein
MGIVDAALASRFWQSGRSIIIHEVTARLPGQGGDDVPERGKDDPCPWCICRELFFLFALAFLALFVLFLFVFLFLFLAGFFRVVRGDRFRSG